MPPSPDATSVLERVVHRSARALGGNRWSRRRFLSRSAVVASALVVSPWDFLVRPAGAYAAVCGTDASCAAGYSVFCCTIYAGANLCPPNSFTGGWWKADNSAFCCGGPRYYVDCNASCGSGWGCECETSSATCDNRLIACNQFRYGQCNQEIACYGPVVCRLVTCTPPWEYDPSCTTASATDDNTVTHTAPCLPQPCPSPIIMRYFDLGGPGSYLGAEESLEEPTPGGTWMLFQFGAMYDVFIQGLHAVHGNIWNKYQQLGAQNSFLSYPATDEGGTADGLGRYNHFAAWYDGVNLDNGSIYWTWVTGAWSIHGAIRTHWAGMGWEQSPVGYPVTDESPSADGVGRYNHFVKLGSGGILDTGSIYWSPQTGAWSIHGAIRTHWAALGWEVGPLGYPTSDETGVGDGWGRYNTFAGTGTNGIGAIYWHPWTGPWSVHGAIYAHYQALGGPRGIVGYPLTDETGTPDGLARYNDFTGSGGASIYWTAQTGAWAIYGVFRTTWQALAAGSGPLGYPAFDATSDTAGGVPYSAQPFQHGAIFDSSVGHGCAVYGPIWTKYQSENTALGPLGLPTTSVVTGSNGVQTVTFQHGTLTYDPSTGQVT